MANYCIKGRRIICLKIPQDFDKHRLQIGIPVENDEASKVGLFKEGDVVLPSGKYGPQSYKNAYGYTYVDKTKPKEYRYVSTNWIRPYGNPNNSEVPIDICRNCYHREVVLPYEIELQLYVNHEGKKYVIANVSDEKRDRYLKEIVNLFLEIFGICYIFNDDIKIEKSTIKRRCNWEILPPGEKPSINIKKQLKEQGKSDSSFDIYRLKCIENYNAETIVEGINGFKGYYAFVFSNHCVLESAIYGNATYIIPKDNWETLSQKTKKELTDQDKVLEKIYHTASWKRSIEDIFCSLGIYLQK